MNEEMRKFPDPKIDSERSLPIERETMTREEPRSMEETNNALIVCSNESSSIIDRISSSQTMN